MCKRIFKFELQLSSYSQNIKFSRYCPKFHIFTNIVIFKYICNFLDQLFDPYKFHGRNMSGILFFIFASCHPLNSKNGLSEQYQIVTIEATPGLCSQNLIFLMYMIHLSSILVYLCIEITQINFHQFFQRILLNMFKHTIIQQEMLKITVLIKQRKCFLIGQLEIVDLLFGIL